MGSPVSSTPSLERAIKKKKIQSESDSDCSVILYIHAPVHIYGVTYYSTTTTSDVVVAITLQDPGT